MSGKTKNIHFCEMLKLAKDRGLKSEAVVMDAWYSSLDNLKTIRSHDFVFVTTLRKNRIVNKNIQIGTFDIPEAGLVVHLRGYGFITVFKTACKKCPAPDYICTNIENPTRDRVKTL